ncbi:NACHT, LRR and PYD domains-containing protein 1 homolog isoform X2 [Stegostoma tigrinum]|uniref:NACHT, LRR and PYD domains-containing protein 1 homolog isoform X2 n=1 Tax=Stegostoma tigrinum TaxID=3053191 RepID=UPI00202ACB88|nr:NACHT, LRR and PYD domains-containing protein 1 homolog isoform X2 [Stegostoma tigrinum]
MESPLYITLWLFLFLQQPFLGEGSFIQILGVSGEDILLPCIFTVATKFSLQQLVITWQRTTSIKVVHSFYNEKNHPEYQDPAFRGRTKLFLQEFPNGNASLRLKRATTSDIGNYTCFVIQEDGKGYIENLVELKLYAMALLRNTVEDAVQVYQKYILQNQTEFLDKVSHGKSKAYSLLDRTISIIVPKKQITALDDIMGTVASDFVSEVKAVQLLSLPQKVDYPSKRVLLIGDEGVGKSWTVASIQQAWAESQLCHPRCIIVFRFCDLNEVEGKTTLQKLLKKQCESLSSVLTELLCNPQDVLIILDGLDEFNHRLQNNPPDGCFNLDTEAEVNVLVHSLIAGDLLSTAQVLVTSRWNTEQLEFHKKYFDCILVIHGFTSDQLRRYCEVFCQKNQKAVGMYEYMTKHETINCLVSNPLNSYILCSILDRCNCSQTLMADVPVTHSEVLLQFLYSLVHCKTDKQSLVTIDNSETKLEGTLLQDTILKLGELSFNNLLSGKLEMKIDDLHNYGIDPDVLSKYFSNVILEKKYKDQNIFEFCHVVLKEYFAALYCATSLKNDAEELVKSLNLWCFGRMPQNQKSQYYLRSFKPERTEALYNFTRLFMGSLKARRDTKLWNCSASLTQPTARALVTWFKNCLEQGCKKSKLLNLMHCLFELHDSTVTTEVSPHFKHIDFFNISLGPLDLAALCYCLCHSAMVELDLRLCTIGDDGIKQLKDVLLKCKTVFVSSNKLTEKSAEILSDILQDPKCRIETLSCGTNCFGARGAQFFWKALSKNQSLKSLRLYDNKITDEGITNMADCLSYNTTLEKLYLCANEFGDVGLKNIEQFKELQDGLKIVSKITEDEDLLLRIETQINELFSHSQEYNQEWLQTIMESILKDLGDESEITDQMMKTRVGIIKESINKLLCKIKVVAVGSTTFLKFPHLGHEVDEESDLKV